MHDLCVYFSQSFFKLAVTLFVTVPIAKCVFNLFSYWISNLSCLPAVQPYHSELRVKGRKKSYRVSDNHWAWLTSGLFFYSFFRVPKHDF